MRSSRAAAPLFVYPHGGLGGRVHTDDLVISITYAGDATTVSCSGELDILTVPKLRDALAMAVEKRPAKLVIDARGITLLSTDAIDTLIDSAALAIWRDIDVEIELSEGGRRIADLAGAWWVGRVEDPYPHTLGTPSQLGRAEGT